MGNNVNNGSYLTPIETIYSKICAQSLPVNETFTSGCTVRRSKRPSKGKLALQ